MTSIPSVPASAGVVDAQGVLSIDLECKRCGYNLRGLRQEGRCPECGTPIGLSTLGDLLRFADPKWVDKVALGLTILLWMILGGLLVGVVTAVLGNRSPLIQAGLALGVALITFYGTWLVTEPDPSGIGEDPNLTVRKILRVSLVLGLVLDAAEVASAAATAGSFAGMLLQWTRVGSAIVALVTMFTTFMYYERLARRIPDVHLAARARHLRWGYAIALGVGALGSAALVILTGGGGGGALGAGVGAIACLLAPAAIAVLVLGIVAIVLLFRLRRAVAEQARLARATWAAVLEGAPPPPPVPGAGT